MLPKLTIHNKIITLIMNSGVQFLDFGVMPHLGQPGKGRFVRKSANGPLLRLHYDAQQEQYRLLSDNGDEAEIARPECSVAPATSLEWLADCWLPLPYLRTGAGYHYNEGPDNWVRLHISRLDAPDEYGHTWRLCLVFDTRLVNEQHQSRGPVLADIHKGTQFSLAWQNHELSEFLDQTWVDGWLREIFVVRAKQKGLDENQITHALKLFEYQAHYLNILEMLAEQAKLPVVQLNSGTLDKPAIPVDLVLDVGNSHTCGIITEDHGELNDGLAQSTALHIRHLATPQHISPSLFPSRITFHHATFGSQAYSSESGRDDAFIWPSIVRTGDEAQNMALHYCAGGGESSVHSPRRYLWDNSPSSAPWRLYSEDAAGTEPQNAIVFPLASLIDDEGVPLYRQSVEERMPVFSPCYSRRSLMTLIFCELLAQALSQINSVSHRLAMGLYDSPRQLRSLVLTLPSAMPVQEKAILREKVEEAIALVWKMQGWHSADDPFFPCPGATAASVPAPTVQLDWDEATCGQLVWLYNEATFHYAGRSELLFNHLIRPERRHEERKRLRVASIDIGGGTTDMSIVDYTLAQGGDGKANITPRLLFREGFKVAGDDLLLEIIQFCLLPAIERSLLSAGVPHPQTIMLQLFGESPGRAEFNALRRHITSHLLIPLAHTIFDWWENCAPEDDSAVLEGTFGELLAPHGLPGELLHDLHRAIQPLLPANAPRWEIENIPLAIEVSLLENALLENRFSLTRILIALGNIISQYYCDVLLITGKPSCLPGIQRLLSQLQAIPANRIVWLDRYSVEERFPFSSEGRIINPKSSAALGALICSLALSLRLPGFRFNASDIKAYSTIRYVGVLDDEGHLREQDCWFQQLELENPDFTLGKQEPVVLSANATIGFRQLANEDWPASPLYQLKIRSPELAKHMLGNASLILSLSWNHHATTFTIDRVQLKDGTRVNAGEISLKLNTLSNGHPSKNTYWLDSGNTFVK